MSAEISSPAKRRHARLRQKKARQRPAQTLDGAMVEVDPALYTLILAMCRPAMKNSALARALLDWLAENQDISLHVAMAEAMETLIGIGEDSAGKRVLPHREHKQFRLAVAELEDILEVEVEGMQAQQAASPHRQNLLYLRSGLGLDDMDTAILGLALAYNISERVESFLDSVFSDRLKARTIIAHCLRLPAPEIAERLSPRGRLVSTGLLQWHEECDRIDHCLDVCAQLMAKIRLAHESEKAFFGAILGETASATLALDDFGHMRQTRDFFVSLLKGAVLAQERGINILLYGPPGCGKTELCKTVAAAAGADLFVVGEESQDGDEPRRDERLTALRFAQYLLTSKDRAAILFDEMEDLMRTGWAPSMPLMQLDQAWGTSGSKVHQNRMLENNSVPVLWACNETGGFDPAFLRRMTYVLELKAPPHGARIKIWTRILRTQNITLPAEEVTRLARQSNPAPALIANAARAVRLAGGATGHFRQALEGSLRVVQGVSLENINLPLPAEYRPELINADHDILALLTSLQARPDLSGVSFCLSGPPGTGKSLFARHLAKQLELAVMEKGGASLLNCYVGETEKRIADAFYNAREEDAMLVIDEIEMFLSSRADARQIWHLSQTNEFLTAMERHPLPWCATTNLPERLDAAALRRFVYKIRFDFLDADRARMAFRMFFGMPAPAALDRLTMLTPADFVLVKRKAAVLGYPDDTRQRLAMLEREVAQKPGHTNHMGF